MLLSEATLKWCKNDWYVNNESVFFLSLSLIIPPPHLLSPVHSFVELTTVLLAVPGVQYILSEKFCQDPVEAFFGKLRAQGSRNENPNAKQFMDNTVPLHVQGSMALDPICGNCRKRSMTDRNTFTVDETPCQNERELHVQCHVVQSTPLNLCV